MKEKPKTILAFIASHVKDHGYPPTVREIGAATHLSSTSTVYHYLSQLAKQGYLKKDSTKPRALEVTPKGFQEIGLLEEEKEKVPIVGTVTAGEPISAIEEIEGYFPLPDSFDQQNNDYFMLRIKGESMINAGILDGDLVLVRRQSTANNGKIVIAMTEENEATCKRFFKEEGRFRLQPENERFSPIYLDKITILGKVVGLFRDHIY